MLKHCFACLMVCFALQLSAQNNLIVLSESGSLFTLFVNDQKINDSVQSVVIARKMYDDTCRIKMSFADKKIGDHSEKIFLTIGGKPVRNKEFTYSLSHEQGKQRLRFISVNDAVTDTVHGCTLPEACIKALFTQVEKKKSEEDKMVERYPEPQKCDKAVNDSLLKLNIRLLKENHIEINRLKDAKWFISHNCIDSKQLMKVMLTFDRSESRVNIAQFSYDYMMDRQNFLDVIKALKFSRDEYEIKDFYEKKQKQK